MLETRNLLKELYTLKQERDFLQIEINKILNSKSWRITKPLRDFFAFIRRKKLLKHLIKTFISLRKHGIKYTINIINIYLKNTRPRKLSSFKYLSKKDKETQTNTIFPKNIKISIITPLYNTPKNYLEKMIDSVIMQSYLNWELCLADGSDDEHKYVMDICIKYTIKDKRIKYKKLDKNEGISENSNKAIEMSIGDYLGLLDHDDLLHPSALFYVMNEICYNNADFIYTDEATFSNTYLINRHYKPKFAIDTLRSCNYICHFSVFSRKLINITGVFNKEFDGSQDHDLILRLTDTASNISHISKILYFWRSHNNSVSLNINNKQYAIISGKKALKDNLSKHGISAQIESTKVFPTIYHIIYDILDKPLISIIIPNKDSISLLHGCINSIIDKTVYTNYEIIIVENNSTEDATFEYYNELEKINNITVVKWKENGFNYSKINNFGVNYAKGKHLIFLNNDIEIITPNWIEEMLMFSQRSDVGAVGIKLYFPDNKIQHAGVLLGYGNVAGHLFHYADKDDIGYFGKLHYVQNLSAVTAACMMVKRSVFNEVGMFDVKLSSSYNDTDLCLKIRKAGYLIVWTPHAEAYHYESLTRGYHDSPEKKSLFEEEVKIFKDKWEKELINGDPYYNCNLSFDGFKYLYKD